MSEKLEFTGTPTAVQSESPSAAQVYDELTALSERTEQVMMNRRLSEKKAYITAICCLSAAIVFLGASLIVTALGWSHAQGKLVPEVIEVEKTVEKVVEVPKYTVIDPSVEYQTRLGEEGFLLSDSNYGPIRMPYLSGVPRNERLPEMFVKDEETGYMTYSGGEEYIAGIDVSVYQGDIDWKEVKNAGFEFAIIRCGNRGYITGLTVEDKNFKKNIKGALDAGLKVGVYFFSQALTEEEALEEAEFIIDLIEDYEVTFPVAYDWEVVHDPDGDTPRTAYIDPEQLTNNFLVFAKRLEEEGFTPVIYGNKKTIVWKYDLARLTDYDIWFAEYNDAPSLPYKWEMWQYTSKGTVPGIDGNVDLNICFKDYSEE